MRAIPTMARLASVPMISRTFILPPHDYEYDGEGDCAEKHTAQYGADNFGNGDGVVVFHYSSSPIIAIIACANMKANTKPAKNTRKYVIRAPSNG
jgi:hypothetical protein